MNMRSQAVGVDSTPEPALDSPAGWRVVSAVFVLTAVTYGSAYSFSAMFPGLADDFRASRSAVALVFSLAAAGFHTFGAVAGKLADHVSSRLLCVLGVLAMSAGYLAAATATSLPALYLFYGAVVGLGVGLLYVPALAAVQSWFQRHRSAASGIATGGLGLGTVLLPLGVGQLLPHLGWRICFVLLGVIVATLGTPAALLVHRRPRPAAAHAADQVADNHPAGTVRTATFARFYVSVLLASICTFIPYVHLVAAALDQGSSLQAGTVLIGLIGVGNIAGRFLLGGIADRLGRVRVLAILTLILGGSFLIWAIEPALPGLAAFALVFGLAYGGCVSLYPAVAADLFGANKIGSTVGILYTSVAIAALGGPTLAGYLHDHTHSYTLPAVLAAAAALTAGLITFGLRPATPFRSSC